MDHHSLCNREADFPSMSLEIYATPDAQIKVTGTNTLIYTWKVDSPVKEQQEYNRFIENSRDLWDEYQRLAIKEKKAASKSEYDLIEAKRTAYQLLSKNGT